LVPIEDAHFSGFLREEMPALGTIANLRSWKFVSTQSPQERWDE
jgi:hypothetical protein